jgi:putative transposase
MSVVKMFIDQGFPVSTVLDECAINKSSFYYKPILSVMPRGIAASTQTLTNDGKLISNAIVVEDIKALLQEEFVDYGYIKVTHYLQDTKGYIINHKKVYRLMKQHKLLNMNKSQNKKDRKLWVKDLVPKPEHAFTYWEFDIKFIFIDKLGKYAPLLSVIDVYTRYLLGWMMEWSIKKEDVVGFFDALISDYELPKTVFVRNDNGSQFESNLVRTYFEDKGIIQEFTKPATPEQNAHIESYHSIINRAICQRFELKDLADTKQIFTRWEYFYNTKRIHSGIEYKSPLNFMRQKNIVLPKKNNSNEKSNIAS